VPPDVGPSEIGRALEQLASGELALVPTDTVYGLAAALSSSSGVDRLYETKQRPRSQPCQVLSYSPHVLAGALDGCDSMVQAAAMALLPGTVTCLVDDPWERFTAASGGTPGSVGLRVPKVGPVLASVELTLVATSANHPGGDDPSRIEDVPADLRAAVGVVLDAGELPGVASSVVDLRPVGRGQPARLIRRGPNAADVRKTLGAISVDLIESD